MCSLVNKDWIAYAIQLDLKNRILLYIKQKMIMNLLGINIVCEICLWKYETPMCKNCNSRRYFFI